MPPEKDKHLENTWPVKSIEEKKKKKKWLSSRTLAHEDATDITQAAVHKAASDSQLHTSFSPLPLLAMPPPHW